MATWTWTINQNVSKTTATFTIPSEHILLSGDTFSFKYQYGYAGSLASVYTETFTYGSSKSIVPKDSGWTDTSISYDGNRTFTVDMSRRGTGYRIYVNSIGGVEHTMPTCTVTVTSSAPYYTEHTNYSVSISNISVESGASVASIVLKVGSQTQSRTSAGSLSIVPSDFGNDIVPTVTITDSRNLATTYKLTAIQINQYAAASVSFNVERTTSAGVADDEGTSAVITATFDFTSDITNLQAPTSVVKDMSSTTLQATISWFSDRALTTPISAWTSIARNTTLYALIDNSNHDLFDSQQSYQISITPYDTFGGGAAITRMLGSAFYTMDFLAGGHGIAFGKASTEEGFDCGMEATFDTAVYLGLSDYQTSGSVDKALYDAIVALGWQDVLES